MTTEIHEPSIPGTEAGANMAGMVREAWLATAELESEVERSTRESAFMLVLEAMLRDVGTDFPKTAAGQNGTESAESDVSQTDDLYSTAELRMDAVSSYLQIPGEHVGRLFKIDEAEPVLHLDVQMLSQAKRAATKEIALLLIAGRTAMGLDTTSDHVRKATQYYRKYDNANFLSTLVKGEEFAVLGRPRSLRRTVRLRGAGVAAARDLAQKLVAE